jgi:ABC-type uncharacterized transport system substrate-binding protein
LGVENSKNVFVLYSFKNPQPYTELINKAILSTLESDKTYRYEYYIEYMDRARFSDGVYFQRLLDFYRQKYSSQKMDLLIAVSIPALDFLLKYRGELFPETPIIFCGVGKRRLSNLSLGPNVTGITWKTDIKRTIDVALNLHPGTRRVVVIGGASKTDQNWVAAARKVFRGYEDEIEFTYLTDRPMKDIVKKVTKQPKHTIIYYLQILQDGAGTPFTALEALSLICQASNSPVYNHYDLAIDVGAVGGYMLNFEAQGRIAGELGLRVLRGENPTDIPIIEEGTNAYMFNWRELKRWNIKESDLPPGSIVRYKELSFWEKYWLQIIAVVSFCLIESLLILVLLMQRAKRRLAEHARKFKSVSGLMRRYGRRHTILVSESRSSIASIVFLNFLRIRSFPWKKPSKGWLISFHPLGSIQRSPVDESSLKIKNTERKISKKRNGSRLEKSLFTDNLLEERRSITWKKNQKAMRGRFCKKKDT